MATGAIEPSALAPRVLGPTTHRIRVADIWTTRHVAWMIGVRDVKAKYKQAALGPLWLLIAPLGQLAAVTIAFSGVTDVDTSGIPYILFALTGLTVWTYVQLSLTIATQLMIANASLVRRSPLPRIALITGSLLGNLPPLAVMFVMTFAGAVISGRLPIQALLMPALVAWLIAFTFGVTQIVSAFTVRFRDMVSAMPLVIQAGIFVTPVGYGLAGAPKNIHILLSLNPISGMIEAWRWSLLALPDPNVGVILIGLLLSAFTILIGWRVFGRLEVQFADFV